jgi:pimeloyl-ACP methyl ester carboxylesterase
MSTLVRQLRGRLLRPIVARVLPGALGSEGRPLTVPGTAITGVDEGSGPPVLLVHPGSATSESWAGVAAALADRHRVLRHDRPTYRPVCGETGQARGMAAEVAEVAAIAELVGEPVLLVGHSSGAVVALEAALASPASCRGLVLYEPPLSVDAPLGGKALRLARAALDAGDPDRAMSMFLREVAGASRLSVLGTRLVPPLWRAQRRYVAAQLADAEEIAALPVGLDRYAALAMPILLLVGERSPAHLRAAVHALAGVLPHATIEELGGQGHLATLRAPRLVAEQIATFAELGQ